jgi:predicted nucleotidyltransferase component of viral defense system
MIPGHAITQWALDHPWSSSRQIEQDLLLSRAICAIASHPIVGRELVFRGGTALHKLHLSRPLRYSEDLDYVRTSGGGIGEIMKALTQIGKDLGFSVKTRMGEHPKVYWITTDMAGVPLRIKVEINTHERSSALPLTRLPFVVESIWWRGSAEVLTFQPAELFATKVRALYQRSKGRDLFDLWLGMTQTIIRAHAVIAAFGPYKPDGLTSASAISNLEAKVKSASFRRDTELLIDTTAVEYDVDAAAKLVAESLLSLLDTSVDTQG